jgi:hypothetical protein
MRAYMRKCGRNARAVDDDDSFDDNPCNHSQLETNIPRLHRPKNTASPVSDDHRRTEHIEFLNRRSKFST